MPIGPDRHPWLGFTLAAQSEPIAINPAHIVAAFARNHSHPEQGTKILTSGGLAYEVTETPTQVRVALAKIGHDITLAGA